MDNISYIFLDIDGTLSDHRTGVPPSACEAVQKARLKGHKVFICTGRAKSEITPDILAPGFDGLICSSGAYVEAEGKRLSAVPIAPSLVRHIAAFLDKLKAAYNLEGYPFSYSNEGAVEFFKSVLAGENGSGSGKPSLTPEAIGIRPIEDYIPGPASPVYKISLFTRSPDIEERLRGRLPLSMDYLLLSTPQAGIYNVEIFGRSVTKAAGIDIILNHYGGSLSQTICFGDSMNDAPMFRRCQTGVCMGNGDERLKLLADYVCEEITDNGLWKGFRHLGLI